MESLTYSRITRILFSTLIICFFSCNNTIKKNDINETQIIENNMEQKLYSRSEFEELFYGKPEDFVIERLGTPDREQELFAISKIWYWYKERTYNGTVNNIDKFVLVRFDKFVDGKVDEIEFK